MTYDKILQLTAEAVGEQLTEKELDALAQAITCAAHGEMQAAAAVGIIGWLIIAKRISNEQGEELTDIVEHQWEREKYKAWKVTLLEAER